LNEPKRYHIETYGCQMNVADSELLSSILEEAGWEKTSAQDQADLIIVNTCSVRERAADRVIGHVQSMEPLRRARPHLQVVVAGCLPQHRGRALANRMPDVDLFIGPDNYRDLPELLDQREQMHRFALKPNRGETYQGLRPRREGRVNAWVSIMRGCNRMCTYCAVPFARGRERSLPRDEVVREAEEAIASGYPAITLLGQTVTSYHDGEYDFAALLTSLVKIEGLERLRFLSPHPADFTQELLQLIGDEPKIARHLHLPVQSGSTRILEAMRRGYGRDEYLDLIHRARATIKGLAVTTDLIVGFPGETEEDYLDTVDLMNRVRFDSAFMFAYSPRERTYAARVLDDDVPEAEKKRRLREIIDLQEKHSWATFGRFLGRHLDVLVEGPAKSEGHSLFGRAPDDKATLFRPLVGRTLAPGSVVKVEVEGFSSHTLRGRQVAHAE